MKIDTRLWQLADSAFPTGSFAHSLGFEALSQMNLLSEVRVGELCRHTAMSALPFVNAAYDDAQSADRASEAFLSNHVANRASRAQGHAFLLAAAATFDDARIAALRESLPFGHAAPAMAAALSIAGFPADDARRLFLFGAVRSAVAALVRLGRLGPLRAQRVLFDLHDEIERNVEEAAHLTIDDACSTAPLLEIAQAAQDRFYSRLFQS